MGRWSKSAVAGCGERVMFLARGRRPGQVESRGGPRDQRNHAQAGPRTIRRGSSHQDRVRTRGASSSRTCTHSKRQAHRVPGKSERVEARPRAAPTHDQTDEDSERGRSRQEARTVPPLRRATRHRQAAPMTPWHATPGPRGRSRDSNSESRLRAGPRGTAGNQNKARPVRPSRLRHGGTGQTRN